MPIILTVFLNLTVNYLLILAAAGLCRYTPTLCRALLGAAVGALHIYLCLLPGLGFLGKALWRVLIIPVMSFAAFGRKSLRLHGTMLVLCLAVDALMSDSKGTLAGICALVLLWLFLAGKEKTDKIPVCLCYRGKALSLTALRDTGNCLRDPVSGADVLVIGPEAAGELTGLTPQQLKAPLQSLGALPGLRLIPYKAVGSSGFLLGLKLQRVRIGSWQGSHIVAFAPVGLEKNGGFEALIGGSA